MPPKRKPARPETAAPGAARPKRKRLTEEERAQKKAAAEARKEAAAARKAAAAAKKKAAEEAKKAKNKEKEEAKKQKEEAKKKELERKKKERNKRFDWRHSAAKRHLKKLFREKTIPIDYADAEAIWNAHCKDNSFFRGMEYDQLFVDRLPYVSKALL